MNSFKYLLSNGRKFHHPEVAKVLYEHEKLTKLVCGSPWFKLKDKKVPKNLIDMNFFINVLRYFVPSNNKLKFIHNYLKHWSRPNPFLNSFPQTAHHTVIVIWG